MRSFGSMMRVPLPVDEREIPRIWRISAQMSTIVIIFG
ncbi:hypothetical protein L687_11580 [Microbacterium maritypicum MF109]|uniref:Uncharacterized protein n=1 Tax=Microbacterium maritypicum MF109 TaxID=1333857 RepID=T5KVY6_MICMQ|nr:hypothetical protein L687_11580 [Microbacterium maritypicum MF109]